jgi:hypothetical protein
MSCTLKKYNYIFIPNTLLINILIINEKKKKKQRENIRIFENKNEKSGTFKLKLYEGNIDEFIEAKLLSSGAVQYKTRNGKKTRTSNLFDLLKFPHLYKARHILISHNFHGCTLVKRETSKIKIKSIKKKRTLIYI